MCVSLLDVVSAEECSYIGVSGAFGISFWNAFAAEHDYANFEFLFRLGRDIPTFGRCGANLRSWDNVKPHLNNTLRQQRAWVVNLSVLNWLLLKLDPVGSEPSVVQIEDCSSNQIVTE